MGAAAIFSHSMNAAQSLMSSRGVSPANQAAASDETSNTSSSGTSSATISANDFLTLLVTEMKNQDPTADTDPNEYINQLVSVNSLEQLIDINQNLSTALGSPTPSSNAGNQTANTSGASALGAQTSSASAAAHKTKPLPAASSVASVSGAPTSAQGVLSAISHASGNLSVPEASAASQRVAHSLDGLTHSRSTAVPISVNQSSL